MLAKIKNNPITSLAIAAGLFFGGRFVYREAKKLMNGFDFNFKSMRISNVTLSRIDFVFTFDFINISKLPITVKNFRGKLFIYDGSNWVGAGNVSVPTDIPIQANKTFPVSIPFSTSLLAIPWGQFKTLKEGGAVPYKFDMEMEILGQTVTETHKDSLQVPALLISILKTVGVLKGLGNTQSLPLPLPPSQGLSESSPINFSTILY